MTNRISVYCLAYLLTIVSCYAQSSTDSFEFNDQQISKLQKAYPEFPGGEKEMHCFIDKNLNKHLLSTVNTSGVIWAQFTIDTLGQVRNIKIVKSLNNLVDNELLRIIGLMPKWTPGKISGKAVDVKFNLPLRIPYENKFCR